MGARWHGGVVAYGRAGAPACRPGACGPAGAVKAASGRTATGREALPCGGGEADAPLPPGADLGLPGARRDACGCRRVTPGVSLKRGEVRRNPGPPAPCRVTAAPRRHSPQRGPDRRNRSPFAPARARPPQSVAIRPSAGRPGAAGGDPARPIGACCSAGQDAVTRGAPPASGAKGALSHCFHRDIGRGGGNVRQA